MKETTPTLANLELLKFKKPYAEPRIPIYGKKMASGEERRMAGNEI
jgi:hypothetical protein